LRKVDGRNREEECRQTKDALVRVNTAERLEAERQRSRRKLEDATALHAMERAQWRQTELEMKRGRDTAALQEHYAAAKASIGEQLASERQHGEAEVGRLLSEHEAERLQWHTESAALQIQAKQDRLALSAAAVQRGKQQALLTHEVELRAEAAERLEAERQGSRRQLDEATAAHAKEREQWRQTELDMTRERDTTDLQEKYAAVKSSIDEQLASEHHQGEEQMRRLLSEHEAERLAWKEREVALQSQAKKDRLALSMAASQRGQQQVLLKHEVELRTEAIEQGLRADAADWLETERQRSRQQLEEATAAHATERAQWRQVEREAQLLHVPSVGAEAALNTVTAATATQTEIDELDAERLLRELDTEHAEHAEVRVQLVEEVARLQERLDMQEQLHRTQERMWSSKLEAANTSVTHCRDVAEDVRERVRTTWSGNSAVRLSLTDTAAVGHGSFGSWKICGWFQRGRVELQQLASSDPARW
jgi:hypothetical protein